MIRPLMAGAHGCAVTIDVPQWAAETARSLSTPEEIR